MEIIGQTKLLKDIDVQVKNGNARFFIVNGPKRSGKTLICKYLAKQLNAHLIYSSLKVEEVRQVVELSYKQEQPTLYVFKGIDDMSVAAKNALLKVTEEPPKNAYFVMTCEYLDSALKTLTSRGTVLTLDHYSADDLTEYADHLYETGKLTGGQLEDDEIDILVGICTNTGEVEKLVAYDINEFYEFVELVVENIGTVSGANAFKISSKLALTKAESDKNEKYDIRLFLAAVLRVYHNDLLKECMSSNPDTLLIEQLRECVTITSTYLTQLINKSINKQSTFDMWCLQIRGVLYEA